MAKILVSPIAFNEDKKIEKVINRFKNCDFKDLDIDFIIFDDGSSDGTLDIIKRNAVKYLRHENQQGVGSAIRDIINYAKNKYDILVIMAGNDKDRPEDIPRLIAPIVNEGYDFVQGSRFLKGGNFSKMPFYRVPATRFVHPFLFSFFAGGKLTDTTNGFRAMRMSIFNDSRVNINQEWLNHYELEPYVFFKAVRLGYKVKEVAVSKIYPPKKLGYTKMKPITGWWSILRPIFLLGLGIKK